MTKMDKSVQQTLIIMGGILVLALVGIFAYTSLSSVNTITEMGQATLKVLPDKVGIYFSVDTKGTTSAEATSSNSEIVDKLTTELIKLGFERSQIQTTGFNVYPDYDYSSSQQTLKGYKATHSIKIELSATDSSNIGNVIDAGVGAGAGISYINFELSQEKQNEYKAQALKDATQDAKIKAEAIAEGLGKTLGRLVSVADTGFGYYPWPLYAAAEGAAMDASAAKAVTTNIVPSDQDVSASITAVFKIR